MTDDALSSLARWHARVTYRTDAGPLAVPMLLREIWDLHDRIEEAYVGRAVVRPFHPARSNDRASTSTPIKTVNRALRCSSGPSEVRRSW